MWRSFFYAVGIGLLLLGGQSLVVDHGVTARNLKMPGAIKKILNDNGSLRNSLPQIGLNQRPIAGEQVGFARGNSNGYLPTQGLVQPSQQIGGLSAGQSRFGPSRFSGPQYGHYGGGRTGESYGSGAATRSNNGQSVFGNSTQGNFRQASYTTNGKLTENNLAPGTTMGVGPTNQRIIPTKEWMPWCLLAAGSIIVLYTNSWRPRDD